MINIFADKYVCYIDSHNNRMVVDIHFFSFNICYDIYIYQDKRQKKTKGQSMMDNPETLPTLGTKDTKRCQK